MRNRQVSIIRLVNEVCGDLQNRCDEVEKPLRDERSRNDSLEAKHAALEAKLRSAEQELTEVQRVIDKHTEKEGVRAEQLSTAESRNDSLIARIEELEASLAGAQEAAEAELLALRGEHEALGLLHRGEIAAAAEELEDLQEQIDVQTREATTAKAEAVDLAARLDLEQNNCAAFESHLSIFQEKLDASEKQRQNISDRLDQSRDAEKRLSERVEELEGEIEHRISNTNALNARLTELERSKDAHVEAIDQLRAAKQDVEQQYYAEIASIRAEVEAEQSTHRTTHERHRETISELEESIMTIKQLKMDLETSDAALQEAQDMRKRLMQAMGLNGETVAPPSAGQRRSRRIASDRAPIRIVTTGLPGVATGQSSFESGASSSGGPTPKRTKPRTSFVVPSLHKPQHNKVQVSAAKRASMPARTRQPLQETPARGNARLWSPEKSIEKPRSGDVARLESNGLGLNADDLDFDASDLFTSTPFIPNITSNDDEALECYDETTAES